jgi:hypothetical protein
MDPRKPHVQERPLYWAAMSRPERKLSAERLGGVNFADELTLLRTRILRLATASKESDVEMGMDQMRLMLGMLEVVARLGALQARVERSGDGGGGEINAGLWDDESPEAGG